MVDDEVEEVEVIYQKIIVQMEIIQIVITTEHVEKIQKILRKLRMTTRSHPEPKVKDL